MSKEWLLREASRGPCQGTFSSPKDSMLGFCHSAKNSRLLSKLIIWAAFCGKKKKKDTDQVFTLDSSRACGTHWGLEDLQPALCTMPCPQLGGQSLSSAPRWDRNCSFCSHRVDLLSRTFCLHQAAAKPQGLWLWSWGLGQGVEPY